MERVAHITGISWLVWPTWRVASWNTMWCLIGCAIGDLGTIYFFQVNDIQAPVLFIMGLAMFNGILTSIALETVILMRQMAIKLAFRTAIGMSLISMIGMETAMNLTDYLIIGEPRLTPEVIPLMLAAGFIAPLPYNYWRLAALGKACH